MTVEVLSYDRAAVPSPDDLAELRLDGQVCLVTGGAGGIGRACAQLLGRRGARITLLDAAGGPLADVATELAELGISVATVRADVTRADEVADAIAACLSRWGRLDILVNSAGVGGGNVKVAEMSEQAWRSVLDVNATGTFLTCRSALPPMLAAGYGRIVNLASIAALEGNPNAAHYSASKAAVVALTKSLAKETATSGILVNAVAPAVIATEMLQQVTDEHLAYMRAKIPMRRFGTTEELARLIAFLASPHLTFSTGAVYDLSGGRATY